MKDNKGTTRFSGINLFLLFIACLASLGTLSPLHSTGRPVAVINDWAGEARTLELTVINGEGLVPNYDPSLVHYMDFKISALPLDASTGARWTLRVEGNDAFSKEGAFTIKEEDEDEDSWTEISVDFGPAEEDSLTDISVDAGTVCTPNEDVESGCIPCSLTEGCVMFIEVDLCQDLPLPDGVRIRVYIRPQEHEYEVRCHKDDDQKPCDLLDSWLTMESTPLEDSLCEGSEDSEERATEDANNATME